MTWKNEANTKQKKSLHIYSNSESIMLRQQVSKVKNRWW